MDKINISDIINFVILHNKNKFRENTAGTLAIEINEIGFILE